MTTALPPIPSWIKTRGIEPEFCHHEDQWRVVGPDHLLLEHSEVEVRRRVANGLRVTVRLGAHIAERTVRHRQGTYTREVQGESTRYVIAEIVKPEKDDGLDAPN